MSWTEERIERLKKMWHDGSTASQIADELGGVSRNAVIGKAHRLGLEARPSPVKPGEEKEKQAAAAPTPKPAPTSARRPSPSPPKPGSARAARDRPAGRSTSQDLQYRSIGPGGFIRQGPGEQQAPIPPAPPRRLVPAKPSPEVADKTSLLDLNDRICKWPMGHPGEPDFHFCGKRRTRASPIASSIAESPTRRSSRAAIAARRRRCRSAARASAKRTARLWTARSGKPPLARK